MMHYWCTDDARMMRWWCTLMHRWCDNDAWVSYLISLNPLLFKNISHVGSLQHFVSVFVLSCLVFVSVSVSVFVFAFVIVLTTGVMSQGAPSSLNFPCFCHVLWTFLYLYLCIFHCHCHRWGSVGSRCHQLSENTGCTKKNVIAGGLWVSPAFRKYMVW